MLLNSTVYVKFILNFNNDLHIATYDNELGILVVFADGCYRSPAANHRATKMPIACFLLVNCAA